MFAAQRKAPRDRSADEVDGAVACEILLSVITTGIVLLDAGFVYLILLPLLR